MQSGRLAEDWIKVLRRTVALGKAIGARAGAVISALVSFRRTLGKASESREIAELIGELAQIPVAAYIISRLVHGSSDSEFRIAYALNPTNSGLLVPLAEFAAQAEVFEPFDVATAARMLSSSLEEWHVKRSLILLRARLGLLDDADTLDILNLIESEPHYTFLGDFVAARGQVVDGSVIEQELVALYQKAAGALERQGIKSSAS